MIRVKKPTKPPTILAPPNGKGARGIGDLCAAFDAGTRTFTFLSAIYGHKSVKDALKAAQHDKCAFCEAFVSHVAHGDVEHFRPKGGFVQAAGDKLDQPGYYWLAYDWSNLFLSCQICNQRHKKNLFPLLNPASRARSHKAQLSRERPLFLDPGADDALKHIGFRDEVPYALNGDPRGQATIDSLGLGREALCEHRRQSLEQLKLLMNVAIMLRDSEAGGTASLGDKGKLTEIRKHFAKLIQPESPYSAMAKSLLVANAF